MNINIKSNFDRCLHSRKTLTLVSLLFMIAMISSPLISTFNGVSPFALGADPNVTIEDNKEATLVEAINKAPSDGTSYVIALSKNINLEDTLQIPSGKNITLMTESTTSRRNLFGANGKATITVETGGALVLDGIIVTHDDNAKGTGVYVSKNSKFTLVSGRISNNNATDGGGVYNDGNFTLTGGEISGNAASSSGGGVYNLGNFTLTGGEIFNNGAKFGGGVYDEGVVFRMTGGRIYKNIATSDGGGVYTDDGDFRMSNGQISNNTASSSGGGVYNDGSFVLSGDGMIFNNTATTGGGVYTRDIFNMVNGIISNNTATDGGGIYIYSGEFVMDAGRIANNTASRNGGGIGVNSFSILDDITIYRDAVFSGNKASAAYNRASDDDKLYNDHIDPRVTWSSSLRQGYNNYDIQYTRGEKIDVEVKPTPTASPSPSPSSTTAPSTNPTRAPTPTAPPEGDFPVWQVLVVIIIILGLVIALLVFYLPKRQKKQATSDWIDSAPT
jgi:hypothetical protein